MAQTIPYDPSIVLGNIVAPKALERLVNIAKLQAPVEAAHDKLNSYISLKRSIDMTIRELAGMNIVVDDVKIRSGTVGRKVADAAREYALTRITQEELIQPLKAEIFGVHQGMESPIDYLQSSIKPLPLAADSIKMDAQYFSYAQNKQDITNSLSNIRSFVSASASKLGVEVSGSLATSAVEDVTRQVQSHDIAGTLIITAGCTHRQADVFAPLILNVDKAVRVWNRMFPNDRFDIDEPQTVLALANELLKSAGAADGADGGLGKKGENEINIVSGATYGSSFVGMVHILRKTHTKSSQRVTSDQWAVSARARMNLAGWFQKYSGARSEERRVGKECRL